MRHGGILVLALATAVMASGCTSAILGTVFAPEAVVSGAATGLATAGAQTLSGASLDELSDLGSTVAELDRILQDHPDAANAERLRELRDHLHEKAGRDSGPDQRMAVRETPRPRRPTDAPLPARKGDLLSVVPPGERPAGRRPPMRPEVLPSGSELKPDPQPVHTMSLKPVRLPR
jgi:hypothetical protein